MDREKWKEANLSKFLKGENMPARKPEKAGKQHGPETDRKQDRARGAETAERDEGGPARRDAKPKFDKERPFRPRNDRETSGRPNERPDRSAGDKNYVAGRKPVTELLQRSPGRVDLVNLRKGRVDAKIGAIVDLCSAAGIRYKFVDGVSLDRLYKGAHQGVVAQVAGLEYADFETLLTQAKSAPLPLVLILDRVQDTGNVGALARTLYALGGGGIVVPQHEGAYIGAGAIKASAGALNMLPVAKVVNVTRAVEQCAEQGWTTYCAGTSERAENAFDPAIGLDLPAALVLGNEEKGVRPGVEKACDRTLEIPFARAFDSLNVSSAGAVLLSLFARLQHGDKGGGK